MCSMQYTLFWPWNEVPWDGVKPALYKWYTIWRHNMLRVYYCQWLKEGVGDGGGTMHNKWVTTFGMGKKEQKLLKAIRRACVFTNKIINDQAKQLSDVYRTATRNNPMKESMTWEKWYPQTGQCQSMFSGKQCYRIQSCVHNAWNMYIIYICICLHTCTHKWKEMDKYELHDRIHSSGKKS